jgi:hypothetical protein
MPIIDRRCLPIVLKNQVVVGQRHVASNYYVQLFMPVTVT